MPISKIEKWQEKDKHWSRLIWDAGTYFRFTRDRRSFRIRAKDVQLTRDDCRRIVSRALTKTAKNSIESAFGLLVAEMINAETQKPLGEVKKRLRRIKKICAKMMSSKSELEVQLGILSTDDASVFRCREIIDIINTSGWSASLNFENLLSVCDRGLALKNGNRADIVFYGFLKRIDEAASSAGIDPTLPSNQEKGPDGEFNAPDLLKFVRTSIELMACRANNVASRLDAEASRALKDRARIYCSLSDDVLIDRLRVIRVMNEAGHMDHFLMDLEVGHF